MDHDHDQSIAVSGSSGFLTPMPVSSIILALRSRYFTKTQVKTGSLRAHNTTFSNLRQSRQILVCCLCSVLYLIVAAQRYYPSLFNNIVKISLLYTLAGLLISNNAVSRFAAASQRIVRHVYGSRRSMTAVANFFALRASTQRKSWLVAITKRSHRFIL